MSYITDPPRPSTWQLAQTAIRKATGKVSVTTYIPYDVQNVGHGSGTATVVDKKLGLVLTNAHIMGDAPSECEFTIGDKKYMTRLVYSDPIHDFAFGQIYTKDGKIAADLPDEIVLYPEGASMDCDIRVVVSINGQYANMSSGTIGRVDRNPPAFADRLEHNIEYISAVMLSGPGTSGALAVNDKGQAVALMKGGEPNIAYLLPLDLPKKALEHLRQGESVPRGTLQVKWELEPLSKCEELSSEWLSKFRGDKLGFAVCAKVVVPEGPADGQIETGDILLELNGRLVRSLLQVELSMDTNVRRVVQLTVWRHNSLQHVDCTVQDLHALTPNHILRRLGAVFHQLPLQTAIDYNIPCQGVVARTSGTNTFRSDCIVESIGNQRIANTDDIVRATEDLQGVFVTTSVKSIGSHSNPVPYTGYRLRQSTELSFELTRKQGGPWSFTMVTIPTSVTSLLGPILRIEGLEEPISDKFPEGTPEPVQRIFRSMVTYVVHRQFCADGNVSGISSGLGLICQGDGLVLVFRSSLTEFDEIVLTIAEKVNVRATVSFLHPALDLAILRFNPAEVHDDLLHKCVLAPEEVAVGALVYFCPFSTQNKMLQQTTVQSIFPSNRVSANVPAMFAAFSNISCVLETNIVSDAVLLNGKGEVLGLVTYGREFIPSQLLQKALQSCSTLAVEARFRDFDVTHRPLSVVLQRGIDLKHPGNQVLEVSRVPETCCSSTERHPLRKGDIIFQMEGHPVSKASELGFQYDKPTLCLRVLRQCQEVDIRVPTLTVAETRTVQVAYFCGAWLQKTPLPARMRQRPVASDIYVSAHNRGTPAQGKLNYQSFITEVNGTKVFTLDDFLMHTANVSFDVDIRVRTVLRSGHSEVVTLKKRPFCPTIVWTKNLKGRIDTKAVDGDLWRASLPSDVRVNYPTSDV